MIRREVRHEVTDFYNNRLNIEMFFFWDFLPAPQNNTLLACVFSKYVQLTKKK